MLRGCFLLLSIFFLAVTVLLTNSGASWSDAATTGTLAGICGFFGFKRRYWEI